MHAMATHSKGDFNLKPTGFKLHECGDDDIAFDVKYCGICHTDVHFVEDDLGVSQYPLVPGHEVVGVATMVGKNVRGVKPGDHVAVGCMVESCKACKFCDRGTEQYCKSGSTFTYGGVSKGKAGPAGTPTKGGYGNKMVVNQDFVVKLPAAFDMARGAPILCAGITMYDPLVHFKGQGKRVGIVGAGGLGQMGIMIAKAMKCEVTVISTSPNKEETVKKMGADHFVVSTSVESMAKHAASLDLILDTVSVPHDVAAMLPLLDTDGTIVMLGVVSAPSSMPLMQCTFGRKSISGSLIGGIQSTRDCIRFCTKHNIYPETKLIKCEEAGEILKLLKTKNDQVIRYVIDIGNTMPKPTSQV